MLKRLTVDGGSIMLCECFAATEMKWIDDTERKLHQSLLKQKSGKLRKVLRLATRRFHPSARLYLQTAVKCTVVEGKPETPSRLEIMKFVKVFLTKPATVIGAERDFNQAPCEEPEHTDEVFTFNKLQQNSKSPFWSLVLKTVHIFVLRKREFHDEFECLSHYLRELKSTKTPLSLGYHGNVVDLWWVFSRPAPGLLSERVRCCSVL